MGKQIRRMSVCHIRETWTQDNADWVETWCGKRSFLEHSYKTTKKDEERCAKQIARKKEGPWKHCPKCVKARQAVEPGWKPKETL